MISWLIRSTFGHREGLRLSVGLKASVATVRNTHLFVLFFGESSSFFPPFCFFFPSFTMVDHFATQHPSLCQQPNASLDPHTLEPEEEKQHKQSCRHRCWNSTATFLTLSFVSRRRRFESLVWFCRWQGVNQVEQCDVCIVSVKNLCESRCSHSGYSGEGNRMQHEHIYTIWQLMVMIRLNITLCQI